MFILRTTILLILLIFSIHNQASAIQIKKGLQDIKIVSADKLNYKSDVSILEGNVIIKVKDIYISSPKVKIYEKKKAEFLESVNVNSTDLNVIAEKMDIDIVTGLITIYKANSTIKDYNVESDLQTLNIDEGIFNAKANFGKTVTTKYEDIEINSKRLEALFDSKDNDIKDVIQIKFSNNVIATKNESRINGETLMIFPKEKLYRVIDDAIFFDDKEKLIVEADFMNIEEQSPKDFVLLASSKSKKNKVKVISQPRKLIAKSRLTRMWIKNEEVEKLVFTGAADVKLKDRKLVSEEVLLNNSTKELVSNIERPKAILLK
ncbi:MAG: hypothetical protein MK033_05245 [Candidatus Caenarcaniphilales bacterium]|nr:hypothetical protein [Candidatus Caenarcaniphilales bacterium]